MEDSGIMSQYRTDPNSPLEQLRKIVEPPTPKTLNAQIEALKLARDLRKSKFKKTILL